MTISGFGKIANGESSDVLQKAFVPFVNVDQCRRAYQSRGLAKSLAGQFCAGGNNVTDTCRGDSGEFCLCLYDIKAFLKAYKSL